jgi:hypothetical protein
VFAVLTVAAALTLIAALFVDHRTPPPPADVEFGRIQARDLLQHLLTGPISNAPVDIVRVGGWVVTAAGCAAVRQPLHGCGSIPGVAWCCICRLATMASL